VKPLTVAVLAALALAAGQPAAAEARVFPPPAHADPSRHIETADFKTLLPKYLDEKGFLDKAYAAEVAGPSPVYTDFFGIQAITDRSAAQIKRDFTPRYASVTAEDADSVTLNFKAGYTARFAPHSSLSAVGVTVPVSHVEIGGKTWREVVANVRAFRSLVGSAGLSRAYLIPNPLHQVELGVAQRLAHGGPAAAVTPDPELQLFDRSPNALLLAPEGVHGMRESYDKLAALLSAHRFDWIGMEMLPASMQPALDDFVLQPEGSPRQAAARKALLAYFTDSWNGRAGPKTAPEDNYYFQLVDLARRRGARVYGIENVPAAYFFFRNGESSFGAAVRNHQWAERLPMTGRGVVFGGSAHFEDSRAINIQDFATARRPGVVLLSTRPLKPRDQS
jgi:hypothetical protein